MKRLAFLLPTVAGGKFSIVKPSPYTARGIVENIEKRNMKLQTNSVLEKNLIQKKLFVGFYLILGCISTNDIND